MRPPPPRRRTRSRAARRTSAPSRLPLSASDSRRPGKPARSTVPSCCWKRFGPRRSAPGFASSGRSVRRPESFRRRCRATRVPAKLAYAFHPRSARRRARASARSVAVGRAPPAPGRAHRGGPAARRLLHPLRAAAYRRLRAILARGRLFRAGPPGPRHNGDRPRPLHDAVGTLAGPHRHRDQSAGRDRSIGAAAGAEGHGTGGITPPVPRHHPL